MMFRKEHGKINVTSLVERVSRYAIVMRNEDRQSKPIMESLINGLVPLPANARKSITFDRGTEFSAWKYLKTGIGGMPGSVTRKRPIRKALLRIRTTGCVDTCQDQPHRRR